MIVPRSKSFIGFNYTSRVKPKGLTVAYKALRNLDLITSLLSSTTFSFLYSTAPTLAACSFSSCLSTTCL